jgi:hypothetical protein
MLPLVTLKHDDFFDDWVEEVKLVPGDEIGNYLQFVKLSIKPGREKRLEEADSLLGRGSQCVYLDIEEANHDVVNDNQAQG